MTRTLALISLFFTLLANAQTGISSIEKYTTAQGLSDNVIKSLLQDKRGFLWIASSWGLNRYDGRTFKQYIKTTAGNTLDDISRLAEDKQGNIWISCRNGICILDPFTETITEQKTKGFVFADREKNIWIANADTVSIITGDRVIKKLFLDITPEEPWRNRFISDIYEDSKQQIWIGSSKGMKKINKKDFSVREYYKDDKKNYVQDECTTIYEDKNGTIWAGTWGGGLLKYNAAHDRFDIILLNEPISKPANIIFTLTDFNYKGHECLLLGTQEGLTVLRKPETGQPVIIEKKIGRGEYDHELNSFSVTGILNDVQQNLWLATSAGLHKIDKSRQVFNWVYLPGGHSNDVVFHVIEDTEHPDSIVYLTTMKGWWKLNSKTHELQPFNTTQTGTQLAGYINQYVKDGSGIWFTSQHGFGYYDIKANKISDYSHLVNPGKKEVARCWYIAKDPQGKIWFSAFRDGIRIFDPQSKTITPLLPNFSVESMVIDDKGILWLKAKGKLHRIQTTDRGLTSYDMPEYGKLHIDKQKRLLAYNEQKIAEFRNGQFYPLYPAKGEADFPIMKLNEDAAGNFWIATHNDYMKVSTDFKTLTSYKAYTNFDKNEIEEIYNRNDHFIATTSGKVLKFNVADIDRYSSSAPVHISSIHANDKTFFFPSLQQTKLRLSYKSRIEIELSALNFLNEKGNRIFYQLEGWDNKWNELSGSALYYEQLPPGNYTLLVKAMNGDSVLGTTPAQFSFSIAPPFWQTWWFITACVLALSVILYSIYKYRLQHVLKMERMRTRIATDLHDDIGATLSSISMYSDAVKKQVKEKMPQLENVLEKMGENSRRMVSSMSDIVWAVNPENDQGKKLLERIEAYARDACSVTDTKLEFNCNSELQSFNFPLEYRKNIYLIFKETLNNALKYADAENISISITNKGSRFYLTISDNGKGFNTAAEFSGNGLKNLKARAKEIDAGLHISSSPQKGTIVSLDCRIS